MDHGSQLRHHFAQVDDGIGRGVNAGQYLARHIDHAGRVRDEHAGNDDPRGRAQDHGAAGAEEAVTACVADGEFCASVPSDWLTLVASVDS